MHRHTPSRREFLGQTAALAAAGAVQTARAVQLTHADPVAEAKGGRSRFRLNYILASR